jgi:hypothetical protein
MLATRLLMPGDLASVPENVGGCGVAVESGGRSEHRELAVSLQMSPAIRAEFSQSWRAVVATFVGMGLGPLFNQTAQQELPPGNTAAQPAEVAVATVSGASRLK